MMASSRATNWVRFRHQGETGFGVLTRSEISVHDGEMFGVAKPSGERLALVGCRTAGADRADQDRRALEQFPRTRSQAEFAAAGGAAVSPEGHHQRRGAGRRDRTLLPAMTARPPMRVNSASSSGNPAAVFHPMRPMTSSSAIPASTTSPPTIFSIVTRPLPNGRGPRVLTDTGRSVPSSPPASILPVWWCVPSSIVWNVRTTRYLT